MVTDRVWAIRGVSDRTRDAVYDAAQAAGLTIGEWIDKALAKAAEDALHPKPAAATRGDVAEVVREQLAPILARLEALEGKAGQAAEPKELASAARAPIKRADVGPARAAVRGRGREAPARPRQRLTEEAQRRIEELHRAGRSAYAISKELGVSYGAVQARVKALEAGQSGEPSANALHDQEP